MTKKEEQAAAKAQFAARKRKRAEKSAVLTIRMSGRDKYELELAARSQGRTITAMIQRALQASFEKDPDMPDINRLWGAHEADRLVLLAYYAPKLMTDEENSIWRIVQDELFDPDGPPEKHTDIDIEDLRDNWDSIKDKAAHEMVSEAWLSTGI